MTPRWLQDGSPNGSKMTLESILRSLGELLEPSWQAGGLLGASWSALGRILGRKKGPSSGSWALQEESQDRFQLPWGPKCSQNGARGVQNEAPEATQAEEGEITKLASLTRKPYVSSSRAFKSMSETGPKLVPSGIFNAEALEKHLESLLEASWSTLGALLERSWTLL